MKTELANQIIEANGDDFIIEFINRGDNTFGSWVGNVMQILKWSDGTWSYMSNHSSNPTENKEESKVWFEWTFCWRGVWEGRIQFINEEFWCEEMETLPLIWKHIEVVLKEQIQKDTGIKED